MPDSSITPNGATYLGQKKYTVNNSERAWIEVDLTLDPFASTPLTITLTVPNTATGTLKQGGDSLALAAGSKTINGNRPVTILAAPVGTDIQLTITVETSAPVLAPEPWIFDIRTLGKKQCVFERTDGTVTLTRMVCDAHCGLDPLPATQLEGALLVPTAKPAFVKGIDPVNAANLVNYIGAAPAPLPRYRWTFTGPATIPDLPDVTDVATTSVNLPATVFQLTPNVTLTLDTWLTDDPTPFTKASVAGPNDFPGPPATSAFTINHRAQHFMVVLDRTGSMSSSSKWPNAKTAARMMTQLFAAIRAGNANDEVGILVFEDGKCEWHADKLASAGGEAMPLADVATVDAQLPGVNLGNPGACTNIGDALALAWEKLQVGSDATTRFAAVLITDGIENAGYRRLDQSTPVTYTDGTNPIDYTAPENLHLSAIGVGSGSEINAHSLQHISGTNVFHTVNVADVGTLKTAATESVAQLFNANGLTVTAKSSKNVSAANAAYFPVNAGEHRVAIAVESNGPGDTLDVKYSDDDGATFKAAAAGVSLKPASPSHLFAVVDLDKLFSPDPVLGTEWQVTLNSATAVGPMTDRLLAWADLQAKADHVFDKLEYRTGEPVTVTVRLRDGDKAISGARVSVTMKRPRRSLGDFLARNSGAFAKVGDIGMTTGDKRGHGAGDSSPKAALLDAILQARGETDIGWEEPPGIFADGTNDLHELAGTGNYSNVYTQTDKEGALSFTFYVDGTLADGSVLSRYVVASKWIGIKVDPLVSSFTMIYNVAAPAGYQAVQVNYRPQDRFGNLLGPYRAAELNFVATAGTWEGDVVSELDGTYHRTLLYKKEDGVPVVTVETQGTSTIPLPVARGCLTWLLRPLLWLLALLLRLLRRP